MIIKKNDIFTTEKYTRTSYDAIRSDLLTIWVSVCVFVYLFLISSFFYEFSTQVEKVP